MTGFWRLAHFVSFVMWIGGAMGVMVAGAVMKRLERSLWGGVADVQAGIYRYLIGPGSIIAVVSGLILTLRMYNGMSVQVGPWLGMMQGFGLLGALVTLLGAMPAAAKLTRLEAVGETAPAFDAARKRMVLAGMIGGTMSALALIAGALYKLG
ncbi:MAG: hypothetical protein IPO52_09205 [Gemmatimonadetes bacterium]|jgi:hypothetical protein|nr:hypothetical protein [Gemmatimonadota bacterium]MBP6443297.1 hypothetical protein [Gemmatimonadales bacterium]MBK9549256.1 hypothetical protein [Gemmatimonadota bacterium]MBP6570275.1 hypothetical protein [Gemmatimonadales bacterium]MBP7619969.1 hypothetical protein [Gemmatimonadales bacterium]